LDDPARQALAAGVNEINTKPGSATGPPSPGQIEDTVLMPTLFAINAVGTHIVSGKTVSSKLSLTAG
jgi:hypothetical protein